MKLSLIIFLSLLIFTGTSKNHASTEDFSRVFIPVNDEEEEDEKAGNKKIAVLHPVVNKVYLDKGISEHQPEAHDGDNDNLKLHKSLQSLREYLEMLNRKKNQKEPSYKEETFEDNGLGPHYHIVYTNEPSMEMLPEELHGEENVGDNPPKDLYFKPIPISDKIGMAERTGKQVGTGGGQQIRETVLLAVSSATLTILLLLTVFCAAAIYYCTKPYGYIDDFSLTSSEKRALLCPSDSSYSRTEDSSLLWNERLITIQGSSDPRQPTFSAYIDEVSTFSDESARTAERDITGAEYRLAPYQATPPSAKAEPPSVPPPAEGGSVPPEETQLAPPPAEGAPPVLPPDEGVPPQPPPAEGAPPPEAPPPAEGAPPPEAPPPAEGAPPPEAPPPAEGAPPPEAPPPAEGAPPPEEVPQAPPAEEAPPE